MEAAYRRFKSIETNVIHAGQSEARQAGAVVSPIFQTANYLMADEDSYAAVRYIRLNNSPNHLLLHRRLAALEGGEDALVTASGMAAITSVLLSFVGAGEHVLAHRALYGGTQNFLNDDAPGLQIQHTPIDMADPAGWEAGLRRNTRILYVESISNPLMEVGELEAAVAFARQHGLVSVIDNTFATPVNFRPLELGFDLVVHSATKYLNGHSDIVAGVVVGAAEKVERVRHKLNHLGGALDPHACFLLERGLKTLVLRVQRQNDNALRLARFLAGHPRVRRVQYPGLETDPGFQRARRLFSGCGGMLSFYAADAPTAERMLQRLRIPLHAASLGCTESLVVRPARSSHLGLPVAEREKLGLTEDLVRVSVGIESVDELCEDFAQALEG
ncbi:MAG TPA: PLP-dependent aspartate aminotransferase family protein [Candidatus Krumholzibacteria bacterium]|nr:PLP-dependent aspartate aminotransferase family protein [Candidatus Krumholzibacteria bacterium]